MIHSNGAQLTRSRGGRGGTLLCGVFYFYTSCGHIFQLLLQLGYLLLGCHQVCMCM